MDPFSITVGSLTLISAAEKLIRLFWELRKGALEIDQNLHSLHNDAQTVQKVAISIRQIYEQQRHTKYDYSQHRSEEFNLWSQLNRLIPDCHITLEKIITVIENIRQTSMPKGMKAFTSVAKELQRQARDGELNLLRKQLSHLVSQLEIILSSIQLLKAYQLEASQEILTDHLRDRFTSLDSRIESLQQTLSLHPTLGSISKSSTSSEVFRAARVVSSIVSTNQHFYIRSISAIFTGREDILHELGALICPPSYSKESILSATGTQNIFVVYGIGGSGKTELCCKLADQYRQRFWGVFWINGESDKSATQDFLRIAAIAKCNPSKDAVKSLLSTVDRPWLLIIDNADDENADIESWFPSGKQGYIFITTRHSSYRRYGTLGRGSLDLSQWEPEAATRLLVKAAEEPMPLTKAVSDAAYQISQALGFLPLALGIAGRTVAQKLCKLIEYLKFYESTWKQARRLRAQRYLSSDDNPHKEIYTTCEMMIESLQNKRSQAASDALELLNTFSFLHRENISLDLLQQSAENPDKETKARAEESKIVRTDAVGQSRVPVHKRLLFSLTTQLFSWTETGLILPRVLQPQDFDIFRLKKAIRELSERSLIARHSHADSYSMHPIVHRWVRERLDVGTSEQALWCHAAAAIVSRSILLPPLASDASDEDFRRELLPHLIHIRECEEDITREFRDNQKNRRGLLRWMWPAVGPSMTHTKAVAFAKYGRVYAQCGLWDEAERMLKETHKFCSDTLGVENPSTIKVQLALAGTLWPLGRGTEAAQLQAAVLETCRRSLGSQHHTTLQVMDKLGESYWMNGRFAEALVLHQAAMEGLTALEDVGPSHPDTLRATDHLGRVHFRYWRLEEAAELHRAAGDGLNAALGAAHLDTLSAMENLAITYLELGGSNHLELASSLQEEVVERRQAKLGREHPWVLMAKLNRARINACRGLLEVADQEIRNNLLVAQRNLGSNHIGVLCGRMYLADTWRRAGRLNEAEMELTDVINRQRRLSDSVKGTHPDMLVAMSIRADCLGELGRFDEGVQLCEEAMQRLCEYSPLGGEHPFLKKLASRKTALLEKRSGLLAEA